MEDIIKVGPCGEDREKGEKDSDWPAYTFEILATNRSYIISAETETEMKDWIETLNFCLRSEADLYKSGRKRDKAVNNQIITDTLHMISTDLSYVDQQLTTGEFVVFFFSFSF